MKKRVLGIICCCFFLALPALCLGAGSGWYGSINAGVGFLSDSDVDVDGVFDGTIRIATNDPYSQGREIIVPFSGVVTPRK